MDGIRAYPEDRGSIAKGEGRKQDLYASSDRRLHLSISSLHNRDMLQRGGYYVAV
jgi:hypothetical protein